MENQHIRPKNKSQQCLSAKLRTAGLQEERAMPA
jgi:hypothetical protein